MLVDGKMIKNHGQGTFAWADGGKFFGDMEK